MLPAELLAQIPLFEGLADEDREALAARLTERTFKAGDIVFSQGDEGSSMYIVLLGRGADLPAEQGQGRRRPSSSRTLRTGEYFGELALFDDKPRIARASRDGRHGAARADARRVRRAPRRARKTAALTILSEMAERLRETNAMLSQRAATNAVKEIEENLTWGQRLADKVAELNGSWAFILFLLGLTAELDHRQHPVRRAAYRPRRRQATTASSRASIPYPFILYNLVARHPRRAAGAAHRHEPEPAVARRTARRRTPTSA